MAYSMINKKDYLKYYEKEKKAGRKPLRFGRWLGGSSAKKTTKAKSAPKKKSSATVRTKGVSRRLKEAGLSYKELDRLRGKK